MTQVDPKRSIASLRMNPPDRAQSCWGSSHGTDGKSLEPLQSIANFCQMLKHSHGIPSMPELLNRGTSSLPQVAHAFTVGGALTRFFFGGPIGWIGAVPAAFRLAGADLLEAAFSGGGLITRGFCANLSAFACIRALESVGIKEMKTYILHLCEEGTLRYSVLKIHSWKGMATLNNH